MRIASWGGSAHVRAARVVYAFLDLADGGAQRLTLERCRHLDPRRFRPEMLAVRGWGPLVAVARAAGVPVHVLGRLRAPWDLAAVPAIAARLRAVRADIVHLPSYSRAAPYVLGAAKMAGVRLVVVHEWSRAAPPRARRRLADRLLARGVRYVAVSSAHRSQLVASGVPPTDIEVVHDGVDLVRFRPRDRQAARQRLGLPADRPIILVPARLRRAKGHADLLDGMPALLERAPGALVLCAGEGPLRPALEERVRDAGLGRAIRWLGQREDVPELMAAADVVALPSRIEGLPAAMLEAFASARPVVATDVGGVGEGLSDGETGRLVAPGDGPAFGRALAELLADEPGRTAMGVRARRAAEDRFVVREAARRMEAAYGKWLS